MQQREGIGSIRGEPRQRPLCVVHSPCHQILTRTIALMNHTKKSRLWAEEEDQRPQKQSVWPCFPPCFPNLLLSRDRERASQQQQQSTEKNPCAAEVGAFFMAFSYFKPRLTLGINQDWKRQFSQHIWLGDLFKREGKLHAKKTETLGWFSDVVEMTRFTGNEAHCAVCFYGQKPAYPIHFISPS